jgi:hypothetical protein
MNPKGEHVGYSPAFLLNFKKLTMRRYLAEEEGGMGTMVKRQLLHTHRAFKAHVLDKEGKEVLYVRPSLLLSNVRSNGLSGLSTGELESTIRKTKIVSLAK